MATLKEATVARDQAFDHLHEVIHVQPEATGIIKLSDGSFGLKVVLPSAPPTHPPDVFCGVPVEYFVSESKPVLLRGRVPTWLELIVGRRHAR